MRALILALALGACVGPPPANRGGPDARPLAGTRWTMATEAGAPPTLEFREAGRASGFSGCNQWFAQVNRTDGALRFEAIGMTRRMCEAAAMEVERDFADRIERTNAAQVGDDVLTLIGDDGEVLARFERSR